MIRKILKWIGIVIGSLLGILVLAFAVLFVVGVVRWNQEYENYEVEVTAIRIPTDQASIERGEHLAATHYCSFCHGQDLSGVVLHNQPAMAVIYAPNLTPGVGGIGNSYTEEDWVRALRYGIGGDGRGLVGMPARIWYQLSDEDLGALIAYLKTLSPVDNEIPKRTVGPLGRLLAALGKFPPTEAAEINHGSAQPVAPEPGVSVAYGEYLTRSSCSACHGDALNGGMVRGLEGNMDIVLNLTPGGQLANWTEDDFIKALRMGETPSGRQLSDTMPWAYVGQMTDEELKAVWMYLQSLPALEQGVERIDW
jgi:cytochrome c553